MQACSSAVGKRITGAGAGPEMVRKIPKKVKYLRRTRFPLTNRGSLSSFLSFSSFLSVLDHPRWYNAMDTSRALELLLSAKNLAHTSTVFTFSKIAALAPGIGKVALFLLFLVNIRSWPLVWHCMFLNLPSSAKTDPQNSACLQIRVPVALAP